MLSGKLVTTSVTVPDGTYVVTPVMAGQEVSNPPLHRYYLEADSTVTGTQNGQAVTGLSYAEVDPYSESADLLP